MYLGSMLITEESEDMREERNNEKVVIQQTMGSNGAEETLELGYYRKIGGDGGK